MMVFMQINLLARLFLSHRNQLKQCPRKSRSNYFIPFTAEGQKQHVSTVLPFFLFRSFSHSLDIVLFVCLFAVRQFRLCHAKLLEEGLDDECGGGGLFIFTL